MEKLQVEHLGKNTVTCKICGVKLKSVTNTHLKKHGITIREYKKKYGVDYVRDTGQRKIASVSGRRPYEHRYGETKAQKLPVGRAASTKKKIQEPEQKDIRREAVKRWHQEKKEAGTYNEWIQRMKDSKLVSRSKEDSYLGAWIRLKVAMLKKTDGRCADCGGSPVPDEKMSKLVLHHKSYERLDLREEDFELLCRKCHAKRHARDGSKKKKGDKSLLRRQVMLKVNELLLVLGVDFKDENFYETPRRLTDVLLEFVQQEESADFLLEEMQSQVFPSEADELVVVSGIDVFGMCPHHILPVRYNIGIGYIPEGYVLGLSKFSRLAAVLAKVPMVQETLTVKIRNVVGGMLGTDNVGVYAEGQHMCMVMRGIEQRNSRAITSALSGSFRDVQHVKKEFFDMVRSKMDK